MKGKSGRRSAGYVSRKARDLHLGDVVIIGGFRTTIDRASGEVFYRDWDETLKPLRPNQGVTKVVFEGDSDAELLTLRGRLRRLWRGPKKAT